MKRAEIAACATALELRWLWDKHNPKGDIKKREWFINKTMEARRLKNAT